MGYLSPHQQALIRLGQALQAASYRFTTVAPATHARINSRPGHESARTLRDVFGWSRPFQESILPAHIFALMREAEILSHSPQGWHSQLRASTFNGMLFFHSAYPTEAAASVFFEPDTYHFAVMLKEYFHRDALPNHRAVDIGCGAGAGAILA